MGLPAIVLAGERPGGNALAQAFGEPAGVLVEVAGMPSVTRVIHTLRASNAVQGGVICGPDPATRATSNVIRKLLVPGDFTWLPPADGPAESAIAAWDAIGQCPVLLTAADHALLTPEILDTFCHLALAADADFVVGLVPYGIVREAFPDSKRTVLKLADGRYCGSNLFMLRTDRGARLLALWRDIQQHRKRPWRMATAIGLGTLLRYLTRRLKLADALATVGDRAGCRIAHVELLDPRAAVDVDSLADHALAEKILAAC